MIKSCVTISLVPSISSGPWIYWDNLEVSIPKAKKAGFDAVELFTIGPDAVEPHMLNKLLEDNDIKLAAVGTGAGKVLHGLSLTNPDGEIRRKAREFVGGMIDFGAQFGAPAIIGSIQGSLHKQVEKQQSFGWLADSLDELGQKAAAYNVKLIYEPLNRYETDLINRLGDGVDFVKSLNNKNVALLADLFHMNIEEESITNTIYACKDYIGYVHLADSNRRPAGMGHIDMKEVGNTLNMIGYEGYLSAEALPYPDTNQAAAQTMSIINEFIRL